MKLHPSWLLLLILVTGSLLFLKIRSQTIQSRMHTQELNLEVDQVLKVAPGEVIDRLVHNAQSTDQELYPNCWKANGLVTMGSQLTYDEIVQNFSAALKAEGWVQHKLGFNRDEQLSLYLSKREKMVSEPQYATTYNIHFVFGYPKILLCYG